MKIDNGYGNCFCVLYPVTPGHGAGCDLTVREEAGKKESKATSTICTDIWQVQRPTIDTASGWPYIKATTEYGINNSKSGDYTLERRENPLGCQISPSTTKRITVKDGTAHPYAKSVVEARGKK